MENKDYLKDFDFGLCDVDRLIYGTLNGDLEKDGMRITMSFMRDLNLRYSSQFKEKEREARKGQVTLDWINLAFVAIVESQVEIIEYFRDQYIAKGGTEQYTQRVAYFYEGVLDFALTRFAVETLLRPMGAGLKAAQQRYLKIQAMAKKASAYSKSLMAPLAPN